MSHNPAATTHPIPFLDADLGRRTLTQIHQLAPESICRAVESVLPAAADPDQATNLLCRLIETASPELISLLAQRPALIHYAATVFSHSAWLGETLIQNPDLFDSLIRAGYLDRTRSREDFEQAFGRLRSRWCEDDTSLLLAHFKRREYVRIMMRDILGIATFAETTAEISMLADVLIGQALQEAQSSLTRRLGAPRHLDSTGRIVESHFAVLSLGKLGGNELNYSSDVDLLYLYDGGEEPPGAPTSNHEYFIRLAQQTTEVLSRQTREGSVFRIDLRLRPQGREGEPAVRLQPAIQYYSQGAHDWELQAMIKARHSAGDLGVSSEFVRAIEPHIYRAELNFVAIKTALQAREKIGLHHRKHLLKQAQKTGVDVKLDLGGIRDIEFLVQCLQREYGGSEPWLRSRGTLVALQKLHDKGHISGSDFHQLTNTYEFLRKIEHRLQLRHGQQTHTLHDSAPELQVLARSLTSDGASLHRPEEFLTRTRQRMAQVQEIYQRIIFHEQAQDRQPPEFQLRTQSALSADTSTNKLLERLALDCPGINESLIQADLSQHARRNINRFFSSAATTSERYAAVLRAPTALEKAVTVFEDSEFLSEILIRHPEDIELLNAVERAQHSDQQAFFSPPTSNGAAPADHVPLLLANGNMDRAEAMALVRQQYRRRIFVSAANDLFTSRDVFQSFEDNTAIAEDAIRASFNVCGAPSGFAIMALGRLSTFEFDMLSDADVLFVGANGCDCQALGRAAENFMQTLTAYTREGTVFPVDSRLRPHGRAGELIVTPSQLSRYFAGEVEPWEVLTYLKLRYLAGDQDVAEEVLQVVRSETSRIAATPSFDRGIREMRKRLESSDSAQNLKTGPGGAYDLDYLAGALQAKNGLFFVGNVSERLLCLHRNGLLENSHCRQLVENGRFLRTVEHLIRQVTGTSRKWLPSGEHHRRALRKLLWRTVGHEESFDPEVRMREVMRTTREIYLQCLPGTG